MRSPTAACIIAVVAALAAGIAGIVFASAASGGMPLRKVFSFPAMMTFVPITFAALTVIFARWNELAARTFGTVSVIVGFSLPIVVFGEKHTGTLSVLLVFAALSLYLNLSVARIFGRDDSLTISVRAKTDWPCFSHLRIANRYWTRA